MTGKSPRVLALYKRFLTLVRRCGRVTVVATKTRIGFQARITFADVMVKKA
ncbi:MAG: hypothetical protein ACE5H2_03450 [Terriglobia bacterium]